jgi:hypothetical protein
MTNQELFEDIGRRIILNINSDEEICFTPIDCFICPIFDDTIRVDAIFESEDLVAMKRRHNAYFITASNHKLYLDGFSIPNGQHYNPNCSSTLAVNLSFSKTNKTYA